MRLAVVVASLVALAWPAWAVSVDGPGVINFPNAPIQPRQDQTAHGWLSPAISTLHTPSFCWELSVFTRSQPLFAYLRRVGTDRPVVSIDTRDNRIPTMPWTGSGGYSGCASISRADERAFLRRPGLYYLDVRTQTSRHAAIAHPRGPRL